ncbi:F-box only protein 39-like [Physella acuta]|uniref:F-box only protein 39-like n=1 Tax=Physella acuta TaxID=109671 RepID=UPI0027DC0919|nr:F-box only protein 39-like [Physella acuta]
MFSQCWENLPPEILLNIFNNLPIKDVATSAQVCKTWKEAATEKSLWRSLTLEFDGAKENKIARRCVGLVKKIAPQLEVLKVINTQVDIEGDVSRNLAVQRVESVLRAVMTFPLHVFELQGLNLYFMEHRFMRIFEQLMVQFLQLQTHLEVFSMKNTMLDLKDLVKILQTLANSAGENIRCLNLQNTFDEIFDGMSIHALNTVIPKFSKLKTLHMPYHGLTEDLFKNLGNVQGSKLKYLYITVEYIQESISDLAWKTLTEACPGLVVSMTVISDPRDKVIMYPHIPLVSLSTSQGGGQFSMTKLATLYQDKLETLDLHGCVEWEKNDTFVGHLETFQKLRNFSMTIFAVNKITQKVKFLRNLCAMLKRHRTLKNVSLNFICLKTVNPGLSRHVDSCTRDMEPYMDRLFFKVNFVIKGV